jgi:DNA polymerase-1
MKIINTADLTPGTTLPRNDKDWVYNGLDCCVTLEVRDVLLAQLDNVAAATYGFSQALQGPVLEMCARGILVNQRRRGEVLQHYRNQIEQLSDQLTEIARDGIGFPATNKVVKGHTKLWWRSNAQLGDLLYNVMRLPSVKKRNTKGQFVPTVNRDAIEKLSAYFIAEPVCSHLLALRDVDKKRMFLETEIDPDGRMRTSFNIAGTNTGRFASSMSDFSTGTNFQNVDRELRSVFISDPGMKFCNIDLEQADARNLGALCWERFVEKHGEKFAGAYLRLCESGDLHTQVCRMARPHLPWTGDPKRDRAIADQKFYRNDSYRDLDKKLGHGSNYLGSPRTMAKHAHVPVAEVEEFQTNYFRALPCIPAYHNAVRSDLIEFATLTTLFGRRRFFFGRAKDEATVREAVAYCPQSMTADEVNQGMLNIWRGNRVQLLCQVHDSILFQYPEHLEDEIVPWALAQMRVPLTLRGGREFFVPAEAKVGWNWGEQSDKNTDGLIKWKGHDSRRRSDLNWKLSIQESLCQSPVSLSLG